LKLIVALALAALWLPASSHALLEHFEVIHHVHADHDHDSDAGGSHEHDADNHDAADGRYVTSAAKVQAPKPLASPAFIWLVTALVTVQAEVEANGSLSGPFPPGTAPPELSHRWQFFFRAALPVRAPSYAS